MGDRYTKAVLSLIALLLAGLLAERLIGPTKVRIVEGGVYIRGGPVQVEMAGDSRLQKVQICDERDCAALYPIIDRLGGMTSTRWGLSVVPSPR